MAVRFTAARYDEIAARISYRFSDRALLRHALTHASTKRKHDDYERLEFLGDRVLSLVVADMLFARFANESEGDLARRHAELVRRDSLARAAAALGLDRALRISRGEAQADAAPNSGMLADAFEAVLGAVFRDGGLEPARRLIARELAASLDAAATPPRDAKTALQEWAQGRGLGLPVYRTLSQAGPPHQPRFVVEAAVAGHPPARGKGTSKRAAEQRAAEILLDQLPDARS